MKYRYFSNSDVLFYLHKISFPKTCLNFLYLRNLSKKSSKSFDDMVILKIFEFIVNKKIFVKNDKNFFVKYPDVYVGEYNFRYHIIFGFSNGLYRVDNLDSEMEQIVGSKVYSINLLSNGFIDYEFNFEPDDFRLNLDSSFDFQAFAGSHFSHKMRISFKYEWDYINCPHSLIVGDTGSGKTYFLEQISLEILAMMGNLYIIDPKNSDLSIMCDSVDSKFVSCSTTSSDILKCLINLENEMNSRFDVIRRDGLNNFSDEYMPLFLIFDEYAAFVSLGGNEVKDAQNILKRLVLKGRQAGIFVIVAMQKADATVLPTSIRDQLSLKIALGNVSTQGYIQIFGSSQGLDNQSVGEGYIEMNGMSSPEHIVIPSHSDYLKILNGLGCLV